MQVRAISEIWYVNAICHQLSSTLSKTPVAFFFKLKQRLLCFLLCFYFVMVSNLPPKYTPVHNCHFKFEFLPKEL